MERPSLSQIHREDEKCDGVIQVEEIAALLPAAMNHQRLTVGQSSAEACNHARRWGRVARPGTIDIEQADAD